MHRLALLPLLLTATMANAEVKVISERNDPATPFPAFRFRNVPSPRRADAAQNATFSILDGTVDPNSGGLHALQDGLTPLDADQPSLNFFFALGQGGRLKLDLRHPVDIQAINSYSRHNRERGPQVYTLYASEGAAPGFNPQPHRPIDPQSVGWKWMAKVDTRSAGAAGGLYAVSIQDTAKSLGRFRYLLFDIGPTETTNNIGNTFYSEIDVIEAGKSLAQEAPPAPVMEYPIAGGRYHFQLNVADTPELALWASQILAPVVQDWYPKIIAQLNSPGYSPPRQFTITFRQDKEGAATTRGTDITSAAAWYRKNLQTQGVGSIIHEMVHVVQQYGNPRPPLWVTEGIADYIRFYRYEPQAQRPDLSPADLAQAHYDAGYRTTARFLDWVTRQTRPSFVEELNAQIRQGHYDDRLWQNLTGKPLPELGAKWQQSLAAPTPAAPTAETTAPHSHEPLMSPASSCAVSTTYNSMIQRLTAIATAWVRSRACSLARSRPI